MALWMLVYGCLLLSCGGQELTPFIAWSNSAGLSGISATERVEDFLSEYTADQKKSHVDAVILFATKKLCFDDLAAHGNVFSSDDGSGELNNIKNIMKVSRSHYWTGLQFTSTGWVSDLATKLALDLHYLNERDIQGLLNWNGFNVISMPSYNLNDHDQIIGSVMKAINKTGITFVAIYTELSTNNLIQMAGRNERLASQSVLMVNEDSNAENDSSICSVGGIFNQTNTSVPCMLFCIRKNVTFIPNASNPIEYCTLTTPMKVSACCEKEVNVSVNCTDQIYPSVTLHYLIKNVTKSSTGNICSKKIFRSFPERPDKPNYEDASPQILVYLQFMFPNNLRNAATSTSWTIAVNVTYTRMWMPKEENKPQDNPPDDDDDDDDDARETISSIIERQGPSRNLYVPLEINAGLSYSCSSNEHNYYSAAYNKNGFRNGSGILLKGIQVQPYNVYSSSFSTSDDCVGYFTITTWMGIISIGTLILILYIGIVAAFSINTIVSFEDSRGETIKVEKIH